MTKEEYRAALKELGWTQGFAASMLGINDRTSRKYANGESRVPTTVERLLNMYIKEMRDAEAGQE